jgi:S1-C subfamily serine protease
MRICVALVVSGLLLSSHTQALEPDQVYAKVALSIVVIVGHHTRSPRDISFGSGVIIAPGQILTNCHVVEASDVVYLKRDGHSTIGIIRYADPETDLCQIGATEDKVSIYGIDTDTGRVTDKGGAVPTGRLPQAMTTTRVRP